jgi:hypothetical protein
MNFFQPGVMMKQKFQRGFVLCAAAIYAAAAMAQQSAPAASEAAPAAQSQKDQKEPELFRPASSSSRKCPPVGRRARLNFLMR